MRDCLVVELPLATSLQSQFRAWNGRRFEVRYEQHGQRLTMFTQAGPNWETRHHPEEMTFIESERPIQANEGSVHDIGDFTMRADLRLEPYDQAIQAHGQQYLHRGALENQPLPETP